MSEQTSVSTPAAPVIPAATDATPAAATTPSATPAARGRNVPQTPPTPGDKSLSLQSGMDILTRRRREARAATDPGQTRAAPAATAPAATAPAATAPAATAPAATAPAATEGGEDLAARAFARLLAGQDTEGGDDTADPARSAAGDPPANGDAGAISVTIGGVERRLTPAQVAEAVQKSDGFTRRTQELAAFARQVNEKWAAMQEIIPIILAEGGRALETLAPANGEAPNWKKLAGELDPAEYQTRLGEWLDAQERRRDLERLQQTQTQETETQTRQRLADGHRELCRLIPEWSDGKARHAITMAIRDYGRKHGYSDGELNQIVEPRHVFTMFQAAAAQNMFARVKGAAPVVVNAGRGGLPPPQARPVVDAEQRFSGKMSVGNAAELVMARRAAAAKARQG